MNGSPVLLKDNREHSYRVFQENQKKSIKQVLWEIEKNENLRDWEYTAGHIEEYKLLLDRKVIKAFLNTCTIPTVRRKLSIAAIVIARRELQKTGEAWKRCFYLSQLLLDLTAGAPSRLSEVIILIKSVWRKKLPNSLSSRIATLEKQKDAYDKQKLRSGHSNHQPKKAHEAHKKTKKRQHSHKKRHMSDAEKHERNMEAKRRRQEKHKVKNQ